MKKPYLAFSLIELLVVIAIISLLLGIMMPSLAKVKSMAVRLKCAHNLKQINLAVNMYLSGNDDTYPCAPDKPNSIWLWMGRGWRPFIGPYLDADVGKSNASVLLCPADRTDPNKYESTSYAYSMAFYHSPSQIDTMNSIPEQYSSPQPSMPQKRFNVAKPSGKILIGEWFSNHSRIDGKDPGWWGWQGSRNHLFADGQVCFLKAEQINEARDGNPNPNLTFQGIKGTDYQP